MPSRSEVRTVWAKGLHEDESGQIVGWYDYNKEFNEQDFYMCWAAATSNLISWWQDLNPEAHAAAAEPEGGQIWATYQESFTNAGGNAYYGLQWWMDGSYPAPRTSENGWEVMESYSIWNTVAPHIYRKMLITIKKQKYLQAGIKESSSQKTSLSSEKLRLREF